MRKASCDRLRCARGRRKVYRPPTPAAQCLPASNVPRVAAASLVNPERHASRTPSSRLHRPRRHGRPMASHLAASRPRADALRRRARAMAARRRRDARRRAVAPHAGRARARSDIVVTMVPNGAVVRELVAGAGRAARRPPAGLAAARHVVVRAMADRGDPGGCSPSAGVAMVDAPVSGAQWGAEAAELVFMCGGAAADIERVRPLLDVMGKAVFHLGPLGAGHAMKCLNNLVTAINFVALSRRPGDRQALRPRSGGDGRRARTSRPACRGCRRRTSASASSAAASTIRSSSR